MNATKSKVQEAIYFTACKLISKDLPSSFFLSNQSLLIFHFQSFINFENGLFNGLFLNESTCQLNVVIGNDCNSGLDGFSLLLR